MKHLLLLCTLLLVSCGFHLQGPVQVAPALHKLYFQSANPYGLLSRYLKEDLKLSNVILVNTPQAASATLHIIQEDTAQHLLSVSSTQQTRQYSLILSATFQIMDAKGRIILPSQRLNEARTITIQANQVLASSNEASLLYEGMQRALAYDIMNRLASREVSLLLAREIKMSRP